MAERKRVERFEDLIAWQKARVEALCPQAEEVNIGRLAFLCVFVSWRLFFPPSTYE